MLSRSKGFTLIELMIAVAIVAILSAIAIPAYQHYVIRAQVTEGITLASALKPALIEYRASNGAWPDTLAAFGATPASGKYVSKVDMAKGVILITYGEQSNAQLAADGSNVLALTAGSQADGTIVWQCGYHAQPTPAEGTTDWSADASTLTTVPASYLPGACRP